MNPRVITAVVGLITLGFGIGGLVSPASVLDFIALAPESPLDPAAALGEVRATYGGMILAAGLFTILAAVNPAAHRSQIVLLACLWFGLCGGRLLGTQLDGSPGVWGWVFAATEFLGGAALLAVWFTATPEPAPAPKPTPPSLP